MIMWTKESTRDIQAKYRRKTFSKKAIRKKERKKERKKKSYIKIYIKKFFLLPNSTT